jgi:hypothetical protein
MALSSRIIGRERDCELEKKGEGGPVFVITLGEV